jgi:hypothetical protein
VCWAPAASARCESCGSWGVFDFEEHSVLGAGGFGQVRVGSRVGLGVWSTSRSTVCWAPAASVRCESCGSWGVFDFEEHSVLGAGGFGQVRVGSRVGLGVWSAASLTER